MRVAMRNLVNRPALVLTGWRDNRRHLVRIKGRDVWLTTTLFTALCDLVHARIHTGNGIIDVSPLVAFRLRKAISHALKNPQAGSALLHTGARAEYRLTGVCYRFGDGVIQAPRSCASGPGKCP
jgi:hypothetical protein